jgi:hypothetical protein
MGRAPRPQRGGRVFHQRARAVPVRHWQLPHGVHAVGIHQEPALRRPDDARRPADPAARSNATPPCRPASGGGDPMRLSPTARRAWPGRVARCAGR